MVCAEELQLLGFPPDGWSQRLEHWRRLAKLIHAVGLVIAGRVASASFIPTSVTEERQSLCTLDHLQITKRSCVDCKSERISGSPKIIH